MTDRTTLLIDTSTSHITAALMSGGTITERTAIGATAHGESLSPLIAQLVAETAVSFADIQRIVVGLGPGPFTGLRIGIVTAEALGHSLAVPVSGFCSLDAIARPPESDRVLVVSDARRKEVYYALYDRTGLRIEGPGVVKPAALVTQLTTERHSDQPELTVVSAGAEKYEADLGQLGHVVEGWPSASWLLTNDICVPGPLTPLYLRRPDAVPSVKVVVR